ncbi:MAG: DNA repair protein RecN [Clostridia bacterium]|nr:DNA repair protein RecN [Clostridia bacterium]
MLRELNIKNFALIDSLSITFDEGFNVLTGETGAGKSIIIDAVNLALGGRANRDLIKKNETNCIVEALFDIKYNNKVSQALDSFGLNENIDETLVLTREINANDRNICRINGRPVTLSMLKEISSYLIDIHGQHEHQSLLHSSNHIHLLDSLSGKQSEHIKKEVKQNYIEWKAIKDKIADLKKDDSELEKKIDFLIYQIEEIDRVNLQADQEEELMQQYKIMKNSQKMIEKLNKAYTILYNGEGIKPAVIDILSHIVTDIQELVGIDDSLNMTYQDLNSILLQIQDIAIDIRQYRDNLDFDPEQLNEAEQRIDTINRLKRKYGNSIQDIINYRNRIYEELQFYKNAELRLEQLNLQLESSSKKLFDSCTKLSERRKKTAQNLEKLVNDELEDLGLQSAQFVVDIHSPTKDKGQSPSEINFSMYGFDKVEFMISTNIGQDVKPLAKIVSGGEVSRIMLALKNVLAAVDDIPSLIFDEIDTGISGRTGQMVAEKIAQISRTRQVICVTHLASIAAMADIHFFIQKKVEGGDTSTVVNRLDGKQTVSEIARLLGGKNITDISLNHAQEMLKTAKKLKKAI